MIEVSKLQSGLLRKILRFLYFIKRNIKQRLGLYKMEKIAPWMPFFHMLDGHQSGGYWLSGHGVHPNKEFYKYSWWIFWKGSLEEGEDFLFKDKYKLNTAEASRLYNELIEKNETFFIYNKYVPRRDEGTPFDFQAQKWRSFEGWALPYDEDPDPVATTAPWKGHK